MLGVEQALPRVVFSDRGPGFYQSSTGHITREYGAALQRNGFRPFAGEDASSQPADVPDVLLHETAVAWVRKYLKKHPIARAGSLDKQEERLRALLTQCEEHINANHNVAGLTKELPDRLHKLVHETRGDRLRH